MWMVAAENIEEALKRVDLKLMGTKILNHLLSLDHSNSLNISYLCFAWNQISFHSSIVN